MIIAEFINNVFPQRQDYLTQSVKNDDEGEDQNCLKKYGTKIGYLAYSYLPMTLYMCCLYIVSVSRESLGTLTIVMVMMINPVIAVPLGRFSECLHKLFWISTKKCHKGRGFGMFCSRLFVMSFNVYLTIIAGIVYVLFKASIEFRLASEFKLVSRFDFKNSIFNKCDCPTVQSASHCADVDMNFQNLLIFLPSEYLLLAFLIAPFTLHVLYSLMFHLPKPIPMLQFILGKKENNDLQTVNYENEEDQLQSQRNDEQHQNKSQQEQFVVHEELSFKDISKMDIICFVFGFLLITGIGLFPYTFDYQFEKSIRTGIHQIEIPQ